MVLAEAFDSRLKELGVDVYCGQEAREISITSELSPSGVRLKDGTELRCQNCISTIHPKNFLDLVAQATFRPAYRKRLQQLEVIARGFQCTQLQDAGKWQLVVQGKQAALQWMSNNSGPGSVMLGVRNDGVVVDPRGNPFNRLGPAQCG